MKKNTKALINIVGIYVSFSVAGILTEEINRNVDCLSLIFFLKSVLGAFFAIIQNRGNKTQKKKTPKLQYFFCSIFYFLSVFLGAMSTKRIGFPTKVLGRSLKVIVVLFFGRFLGKKQYPMRKYIIAVLITLGVISFSFFDPKNKNKMQNSTSLDPSYIIGFILLVTSLFFDGLLNGLEEKVKKTFSKNMEGLDFYLNFFTGAISFIIMLFNFQHDFLDVMEFMAENPDFIWKISLFVVLQTIGTIFILNTIKTRGTFLCSIVTTTRKFVSVLLSIFIFGHQIALIQWLSIILVFSCVLYDIFSKTRTKNK